MILACLVHEDKRQYAMDMCLKIKHAPRRGDTFVVSIDAINAKGFGVGRIKAAVGPQEAAREYRVSVRYAVPGDDVEIGRASCRERV